MSKVALITGFTGQDGTFLTRLLLDKGYKVIGLVRRISTEPPRRVRGKFDFSAEMADNRLVLEEGDLLSTDSLIRIINTWRPDEVYNLAAQSHVGVSFKQPEFTIDANFDGVVNLITALEAVEMSTKTHRYDWRLYQASTSEMFGHRASGQVFHEKSKLKPNSPYAIAKTAAHHYCAMKRQQGRFISCGILFNHESEIRGGDFVTQKIVQGAVSWLKTGEPIRLGNIEAQRDWGYAGDYVKAMWLMLQADLADDYVISTGQTHSIRDFIEETFHELGISLTSNGAEGAEEVLTAIRGPRGGTAVVIDEAFYRPNDVGYLLGNSDKAAINLGWKPEHSFGELIEIMVKEAAK